MSIEWNIKEKKASKTMETTARREKKINKNSVLCFRIPGMYRAWSILKMIVHQCFVKICECNIEMGFLLQNIHNSTLVYLRFLFTNRNWAHKMHSSEMDFVVVFFILNSTGCSVHSSNMCVCLFFILDWNSSEKNKWTKIKTQHDIFAASERKKESDWLR